MAVLLFEIGAVVFEVVAEGISLQDGHVIGRYFARFQQQQRPTRLVLVEARRTKAPDAATRRAMIDGAKSQGKAVEKALSAVALDSALLRGTLTAISWFYEGDAILRPFANMKAGCEFLMKESRSAQEVPKEALEIAMALDELYDEHRSPLEVQTRPTFVAHAKNVTLHGL